MATTTPNAAKAPRSQFLQKLHALLDNPLDPDGLRWVSDDSFEISSKDSVAIHALSPQFEFHSLSSFIRQLSYYSFRRLSDRRRSTERRASNTGYIVFTHPTGHFVRNDPSRLTQIIRKARNRPEKGQGRRVSMCSAASDDYSGPSVDYNAPPPLPHLPQWTPPDFRPQYGMDRQPLPSLHQLPSFVPTLGGPRQDSITQWRNYSPSTSSWLDPNRGDMEQPFAPAYRRASLGDFKLTSSGQPAYAPPLASLAEERPRLRKAVSSQEVPTVGGIVSVGEYALPPQHQNAENSFRTSPYPTPTFESTAPTYFGTYGQQQQPQPQQQQEYSSQYTSVAPPSHAHLTYEPIPSHSHFSASYAPVVGHAATTKPVASGIPLPSPGHSPQQQQQQYGSPSPTQSPSHGNVPLPATGLEHHHLDPRQLVGGPLHYGGEPSTAEYAPQLQLPRMSLPTQYHSGGGQQQYQQQYQSQPSQWSPAPIRTAY